MKNRYQFDSDTDDLWLKDVRRIVSPNYDDRPAETEIELLVIHGISLPPSRYGGPYIDQLFTNSLKPEEDPYFKEIMDLRVSSHLFIDRQGQLTQYVALNKRAWHAGESEYCGHKVCNDFSIGVELEGTDDEAYESQQYECLADVTSLIMSHWKGITKKRIVGHCDIAQGRKTDPGSFFDWDNYFQRIEVE